MIWILLTLFFLCSLGVTWYYLEYAASGAVLPSSSPSFKSLRTTRFLYLCSYLRNKYLLHIPNSLKYEEFVFVDAFLPHWSCSYLGFILPPKEKFSAYVDDKMINLFKLEMYLFQIPNEFFWFHYVVYCFSPILLFLKSWLGNVWSCWLELLLLL